MNHAGLLHLFGRNLYRVSATSMLETPHFHTSSTRPRLLVTTCVTWQPLKVEDTRNNIVVTFEETVWFSCYSLVYLPQGPTYVGGAGDEITVPATERCATEFRLSELAQETVHYLSSRDQTPLALSGFPASSSASADMLLGQLYSAVLQLYIVRF